MLDVSEKPSSPPESRAQKLLVSLPGARTGHLCSHYQRVKVGVLSSTELLAPYQRQEIRLLPRSDEPNVEADPDTEALLPESQAKG